MFFRVITLATILLLFGTNFVVEAQVDLCPPPEPSSGGDYKDICTQVFRIVCYRRAGGVASLSGFSTRVDGVPGIVTALHGVLDCKGIEASNLESNIGGLRVDKADIRHDSAFLTAETLPILELRTGGNPFNDTVRLVGYPLGVRFQKSRYLETDKTRPLPNLEELLPASDKIAFQKRGSPDPSITVLSLTGPLTHGESGGPILTERGQVVAVANGGLLRGTIGMNWAIPYDAIKWRPLSEVKTDLDGLSGADSEDLFGVSPEPVHLPPLYLADGGDPTGRIYKLENDDLSEYYKRDKGRIYNLAVAPNGTIYFSDNNDPYLYKLRNGREIRVYTHNTYLRDVEFDPLGRLYFSESTGAGNDGAIYRLENGEAALFYQVRLDEVDGFWAGDFAFDDKGFLWLSSGNRVPANLYKVVELHPKRMFTDSGSIAGLAFIPGGYLLYTDWRQSIHRLGLPDLIASSPKYSFGAFKWLSDVEPAKTENRTIKPPDLPELLQPLPKVEGIKIE